MVKDGPRFIALMASKGIDPLKLDDWLQELTQLGTIGQVDLLFAHDYEPSWPLFKTWADARRFRLTDVPKDGQPLLGVLSQTLVAAWDGVDPVVGGAITEAQGIGMAVHVRDCRI